MSASNYNYQIKIFNNLLPKNLHQELYILLTTQSKWRWGHGSIMSEMKTEDYALPFWYFELNDEPIIPQICQAIKPQIPMDNYDIKQVYANGHTYGQGGRVHIDHSSPDAYTLLYYPMLHWENSWQGETMYFDSCRENAKLIHTQIPQPNTAILFNSNIPHVGRPPSRHCKELRITVAFKLQLRP